MKKRTTRPRRRRAPRRVRRARKGGQEKVYTFKFNPSEQYLVNVAAGATFDIKPVATQPLKNSSFILTGGSLPNAVPSDTGFVNYYDTGCAVSFALSDMANYAGFTALYDQYRINSVRLDLEFIHAGDGATGGGGGIPLMPRVYAIADYDDAEVPAIMSQITARPGHRKFIFGNKSKTKFSMTIKPKVASLVYNDATTGAVGFSPKTGGWQDCKFASNNHYGLKMWFKDLFLDSTTLSDINMGFRWTWTYNISFKGTLNAH